jgi:uncharacterized damage-inducible protein DinB
MTPYLLPDLLRHNAWANTVVVESLRANPGVLETICYDNEPLLERLHHMAGTERGFLGVFRREKARPPTPASLEDLAASMAETAAALDAFTIAQGIGRQEDKFFVPWFNAEIPFHMLVTQVAGHSSQHRSELAWELARAGVDTGELDFIVWLAGGKPRPGEPLRLPPR